MRLRSATRVLVVLAASAALAQSAQPGATASEPILNRPGLAGGRGAVANRTAVDPQGLVAMRERVTDMEGTLSKMRGALKQMHANAQSKAVDSLTKANLDLWELMVGHLDKELEQLHVALAEREDLEARRADLYRQADAKAAAKAQAARAAQAARFAEDAQKASGTVTPAPASESREQSHPAQTAPAQPSAAPH